MSRAKLIIYILIFVIIFGTLGYVGYTGYDLIYGYPSNSPKDDGYLVKVETGDTLEKLAKKLEAEKIVRSGDTFMLIEKTAPISGLVPGTYKLKVPASQQDLLVQIDNETQRIAKENREKTKREVVKVTFPEGFTAEQMFQRLADNGVASFDDLKKYALNPKNFDTKTYTFLPKPLDCQYGDIKTCAKYYIEGYLYPDTYEFYKKSDVGEVFDKLLDNFNAKVWTKVRDIVNKNGRDFHKDVIMASVVEKETGRTRRGVTELTADEVAQERALVAGVFYNRIQNNMLWQSNVTINYGLGRGLCEQTIKIENCVPLEDPLTDTKYNTYRVKGYPIGPVSSPQINNILAVLNPTNSDYLFFVADDSGKTYFGKTQAEHDQNIARVNQINSQLAAQ